MPTYFDRVFGELRWQVSGFESTSITLYQEDYEHLINHKIMANNEEAIKETVIEPDVVELDKNSEVRRVFYKETPKATYYPLKKYTGVVVEYADLTRTDGRIVTSFPTKKVGKENATRVYDRNKQD